MPLVKAIIINTSTGLPLPIMFNPEEYSISRSAKYCDAKIPGLESPITEFNLGHEETLSMDLFFDTYESGLDVRIFTERIAALIDLDPITDRPPVCLFAWGTLVFECVLQSVTKRFTMFDTFGLPVRATLSVQFRGFNALNVLLAKNPFRSLGHSKTHTVKAGETLSQIAWQMY